MLVEHFTAENPVEKSREGNKAIAWELLPGRDNDWWDCFVGCNVAASMLGCGITGEKPAKKEIRTFVLPGGARRG
jgi:hypothetical protein